MSNQERGYPQGEAGSHQRHSPYASVVPHPHQQQYVFPQPNAQPHAPPFPPLQSRPQHPHAHAQLRQPYRATQGYQQKPGAAGTAATKEFSPPLQRAGADRTAEDQAKPVVLTAKDVEVTEHEKVTYGQPKRSKRHSKKSKDHAASKSRREERHRERQPSASSTSAASAAAAPAYHAYQAHGMHPAPATLQYMQPPSEPAGRPSYRDDAHHRAAHKRRRDRSSERPHKVSLTPQEFMDQLMPHDAERRLHRMKHHKRSRDRASRGSDSEAKTSQHMDATEQHKIVHIKDKTYRVHPNVLVETYAEVPQHRGGDGSNAQRKKAAAGVTEKDGDESQKKKAGTEQQQQQDSSKEDQLKQQQQRKSKEQQKGKQQQPQQQPQPQHAVEYAQTYIQLPGGQLRLVAQTPVATNATAAAAEARTRATAGPTAATTADARTFVMNANATTSPRLVAQPQPMAVPMTCVRGADGRLYQYAPMQAPTGYSFAGMPPVLAAGGAEAAGGYVIAAPPTQGNAIFVTPQYVLDAASRQAAVNDANKERREQRNAVVQLHCDSASEGDASEDEDFKLPAGVVRMEVGDNCTEVLQKMIDLGHANLEMLNDIHVLTLTN